MFFVGVDLGQRRDFSALAVVERTEVVVGFDYVRFEQVREERFALRFLERVALGTSYVAVVRRVALGTSYVAVVRRAAEIVKRLGWCVVVVDGTGVGASVVDLMREEGMDCELVPVSITGGGVARRAERGWWNTPKKELIVALRWVVDSGRMRVARGLREYERLVRELMHLKVRVSAEGHEGFGAAEPEHDDLAMAVGLACWRAARQGSCGERGQRLCY